MRNRDIRLPRARRSLSRLPDDGWIAGNCEGLGRHFDIDPSVLRVVAVIGLLTLTTVTILAYLMVWAIVPAEMDD